MSCLGKVIKFQGYLEGAENVNVGVTGKYFVLPSFKGNLLLNEFSAYLFQTHLLPTFLFHLKYPNTHTHTYTLFYLPLSHEFLFYTYVKLGENTIFLPLEFTLSQVLQYVSSPLQILIL